MPYTRFEQVFFSYLDILKRYVDASPLVLGAISGVDGGFGGRPGGFIGYLPQTRVTFDNSEASSYVIPESGASLLDNLNRIRARISDLEAIDSPLSVYEDGVIVASGVTILDFLTGLVVETETGHVTISGVDDFTDLYDTPNSYTGQGNKFLVVRGDEAGIEFQLVTISGDTMKVKVSANDTTEDYLESKIVAGDGITIATLNDGSNEDLEISTDFTVKVSEDDTTADILENKIQAGTGITITTISGGSNEHLEIVASGIPWENITGIPQRVMTFGFTGNLSVKTLEPRLHAPFVGSITNVTATVNTAPIGSSIIIDVFKNGSTIFTTSANRPTITAGSQDDLSSVPDVTSVALNDIFTVGIIQIGSSTAGADLVLQIRCDV